MLWLWFDFQTSLFGEGTYLTSDLSMAILYSPHGNGWRESVLGPLISCVALCEIIDHPDVKCQVKKKGNALNDKCFFFNVFKRIIPQAGQKYRTNFNILKHYCNMTSRDSCVFSPLFNVTWCYQKSFQYTQKNISYYYKC